MWLYVLFNMRGSLEQLQHSNIPWCGRQGQSESASLSSKTNPLSLPLPVLSLVGGKGIFKFE